MSNSTLARRIDKLEAGSGMVNSELIRIAQHRLYVESLSTEEVYKQLKMIIDGEQPDYLPARNIPVTASQLIDADRATMAMTSEERREQLENTLNAYL